MGLISVIKGLWEAESDAAHQRHYGCGPAEEEETKTRNKTRRSAGWDRLDGPAIRRRMERRRKQSSISLLRAIDLFTSGTGRRRSLKEPPTGLGGGV